MSNVTIQDVFEQFLPTIADRSFSDVQLNAIRCIRNSPIVARYVNR